MAEPKKYYRPGLRFKAHDKAKCHQECCFKGAEEVRNSDGTLRTEAIRPLWAEFGVYGGEYRPTSSDGEPLNDLYDGHPLVFADIRGGFFDLDAQAQEKDWSDDEKEIVARHMLTLLEKPGLAQFSLMGEIRVPAPWPTYDSTHHNQVAALAAQLGLVREALVYESQNKKRQGVIDKLKEAVSVPAPVPVDVEDEVVAA